MCAESQLNGLTAPATPTAGIRLDDQVSRPRRDSTLRACIGRGVLAPQRLTACRLCLCLCPLPCHDRLISTEFCLPACHAVQEYVEESKVVVYCAAT